jgi:hypothetical protein
MINAKEHNFGKYCTSVSELHKDEKISYIFFDIMTISISLEIMYARKHKLQHSYFPRNILQLL